MRVFKLTNPDAVAAGAMPLNYNQMAPSGFLWAVKGLVQLLGPKELPLRTFALQAGIAALGGICWLARMIFGRWPAVLAAAAVALSLFDLKGLPCR